MQKSRKNGQAGTLPGIPGKMGPGPMHIYRIRDTNRCENSMTDAAEAAFEHGQFTKKLNAHYERWPAISASCLRQPARGGMLMVRLVSELPTENVNQTLIDLLAMLNQEYAESGLLMPRFQLLDPVLSVPPSSGVQ